MPKLSWHKRIIKAVQQVHVRHGFTILKPGNVYFRLPQDRNLKYQPDALLLRSKRGIHAVIIEVETKSPAKTVAGDINLAALVRSRIAEMYPHKSIGIGKSFRKTIQFWNMYDARRHAISFHGNKRLKLPGSWIGKLSFLLIVPDRYSKDYNGRFLETFLRRQWGRRKPFHYHRCVSCNAVTLESARRSIGRILSPL